jgi:methyl-accepting chemotaxis protein
MKTENSKKPSPPRRRYLIDRPMQLAHSGFIVWAVGIGMIIAWLVTYYTIWSLVLNQISQETQLPQILHDVNLRLFWTLVIPGVILLLIVAWIQIFLSHRIAGPAYRLRKTITNMTQGLWPKNVQVRNNDFLKDVVEEFNLLITAERGRYIQLATQIKEASELLNRLEAVSETDKQKLAASRETLDAALSLIDSVLSKPDLDNNDQTK